MKKEPPIVSIVMSTYNDERYISKAIKSVVNQTYVNWEFIIINDNSSDKTEYIIFSILKSDPRLVYIKNKKNLGLTANLNKGIKKAKGKYIARIDSDDIWTAKSKLNKQVKFLNSHLDYALIGTWAQVINENNQKLYVLKYPIDDKEIKKVILRENCFLHSSVLIRKEDLKDVGYYNSNNETSQDHELWLELGRRRKLCNIPQILIKYRLNSEGTSRTKRIKQLNETIKAIKKNRHYYPGFTIAWILWNTRKFYPRWFSREFSMELKDNIRSVLKL